MLRLARSLGFLRALGVACLALALACGPAEAPPPASSPGAPAAHGGRPGPGRTQDFFEEMGILELLWGLKAMEASPQALSPEQRRRMQAHLQKAREGLQIIAWAELSEAELSEAQMRFVEEWRGTESDSAEVTLAQALAALEPLAGRPPALLEAPEEGFEPRGVDESPAGYERAAAVTAMVLGGNAALRPTREQARDLQDSFYTLLEGDRMERQALRAMASLLSARQKQWLRERREQWRVEYSHLREFDDLNSRDDLDVHLARALAETYAAKD